MVVHHKPFSFVNVNYFLFGRMPGWRGGIGRPRILTVLHGEHQLSIVRICGLDLGKYPTKGCPLRVRVKINLHF
jgi:hypothetical protein